MLEALDQLDQLVAEPVVFGAGITAPYRGGIKAEYAAKEPRSLDPDLQQLAAEAAVAAHERRISQITADHAHYPAMRRAIHDSKIMFSSINQAREVGSHPLSSLQIENCPPEATLVLEFQRECFVKDQTGHAAYEHLFVLFDKHGQVVSGEGVNPIAIISNQEEKPTAQAYSLEAGLEKFRIRFLSEFDDETINWFFTQGHELIFNKLWPTQRGFTTNSRIDLPLEVALPCADLMHRFPEYASMITELFVKFEEKGLILLSALDQSEDIQDEQKLTQLQQIIANPDPDHQSHLGSMIYHFAQLVTDTQNIPDLVLKKNGAVIPADYLIQNTRKAAVEMVEAALSRYSFDPESFSWDLTRLSVIALYDLLNIIFQINSPRAMPPEGDMSPQLEKLAESDYGGINEMAMLVIHYFFKGVLSGADPEMKQASINFYGAMGDYLDEIASTTTGNLEQEIERMVPVAIKHLRDLDIDQFDFRDLGCRKGRFLEAFLKQLQANGLSPRNTIGFDILPLKSPNPDLWELIQADLSSLDFPQVLAEVAENDLPRVFTCTWSVLNDMSPAEQHRFFINLSKIMKSEDILIVDVADASSYLKEIIQFKGEHIGASEGMMARDFPGPDKTSHGKPFNITPGYRLMVMAFLEEFSIVNHADFTGEDKSNLSVKYTTPVGHHRMTLVLKKRPA